MLRQAKQATLILRNEVTVGLMIHRLSCFEHRRACCHSASKSS